MGVDFYWIKLSNNIARIAAFCLGLSACSPHPGSVKSAQPAPPLDACGALVKTGQPSLCILPSGESFVVGLPSAHGWQRGTQVRISVEKQGLTERWPDAIVIVSETWANIAKVSVLYQRVLTLHGGYAHKLAPDERAPLGKFIGHVARIEGQHLQGVADNERKIGKKILLALGLADNRINEKLRSAIEHVRIEERA